MALYYEDKKRPTSRILIIALVVVSLLLVTLYAREDSNGFFHKVQNVSHQIFSPLVASGSFIGAGLADIQEKNADAQASKESITELQKTIDELRFSLAELDEYRQMVVDLQGLLNIKEFYNLDGVVAQVIGRNTESWNQTVTINVGTQGGVTVGLTVLSSSGVVGQVIAASPTTATIRLVTDPASGVAALIQTTRDEGIVKGSLTGVLYLENIDPDAVVNVGDVVLTSGLGGSFTRGLLIGTVIKVEGLIGDSTRRIIVSPNDKRLNVLETVFVVSSSIEEEEQ